MIPRPVRPFLPALTAALILVVAGCTRGWNQPRDPFRPGADGPGEVQIRVENLNFSDATVYARRGGERLRLGMVTGKSDQEFDLRWSFTDPMQFEVSLVGSAGCTTRTLPVAEGETIWLRIPVDIHATPCLIGK